MYFQLEIHSKFILNYTLENIFSDLKIHFAMIIPNCIQL